MIIKIIELVNICAIFPSLHTGIIAKEDFLRLVQESKVIDSESSAYSIINEAINAGIITFSSEYYTLTSKGKKISRTHTNPSINMIGKTKECFIKYVLLDPQSNNWCCNDFISQFNVDTILQTFVYTRKPTSDRFVINWLLLLSDIGLIEVNQEKAMVNRKYLGFINEMLLHLRNPVQIKIENNCSEKKELGDFAENLALQYEKDRLITAGYSSLASLIQHVSQIDQSAGYDILSFQGNGPHPNNNIYIEVKSTKQMDFCFFWSFNEMNTAKREGDSYWVYGYTEMDITNNIASGPIKICDPIRTLPELGYTILPLDCYINKQ